METLVQEDIRDLTIAEWVAGWEEDTVGVGKQPCIWDAGTVMTDVAVSGNLGSEAEDAGPGALCADRMLPLSPCHRTAAWQASWSPCPPRARRTLTPSWSSSPRGSPRRS